MLAAVAPATLARLRFPLGELQQAGGARARASRRPGGRRQAGLPGPLLPRRAPAATRSSPATATSASARATLLDTGGRELGPPQRRTPLHRRAAPRPAASAAARRCTCSPPTPTANTVTVGPREALAARTRRAARRRCCTDQRFDRVRLRYRQRAVRCTGERRDGGLVLSLAEPAYGVAPGQLACLMDGEMRRRPRDDRVALTGGRRRQRDGRRALTPLPGAEPPR